ncbi:hypothetical protein [Corynebacterium nuruki]|jgi:hypothetical protein|uniref:hypothetical protein n=1 Tax=Corynebacterium nuruki TaxID=1032851 RepID=UPI0039BFA3A6
MSHNRSVEKHPGNPVAQRKDEVHRRSRALQVSGGVAVAGVVLGLFASGYFYVVALVAVVVFGWNAWKIREVVTHKDVW